MLDKIAVREMLAQYKSWNDAEQLARIEDARRRTPEEGLRTVVEMMEFCLSFRSPEAPSQEPRPELLAYYENIERFEAWRRAHGKSAG